MDLVPDLKEKVNQPENLDLKALYRFLFTWEDSYMHGVEYLFYKSDISVSQAGILVEKAAESLRKNEPISEPVIWELLNLEYRKNWLEKLIAIFWKSDEESVI